MTLLSIAIAAVAVNQIVEIWRHSSLFAGWRSYLQIYRDNPDLLSTRRLYRLIELLLCPWCLSVWVSLIVFSSAAFYPPSFGLWSVLAISRAANVVHDVIRLINSVASRVRN